MTELGNWLDDLLIEEFHEAGIWLPEEIEALAAERKLAKRRAELFAAQMRAQAGMGSDLAQAFGQQILGLQPQSRALGGGIGSALGGLFGGLR